MWDYGVAGGLLYYCVVGGGYIWDYYCVVGGLMYCCVCGRRWIYVGLWCGRWSPELLCVVGDGYIWDYCVADALLNCCVVGGEYIWGYGVAGGLLYCCMWEEVDISGIIVLQVVFCTAVCGRRWIYLGLLCGRCSYVLLCVGGGGYMWEYCVAGGLMY